MAKQLLFYALVVLSIALTCNAATLYAVGDTSGWDISTDIDTWAKDKKFVVGDVLMFQYSSSHSVSEVTKENYQGCNATNILQTSRNGNTTFVLSSPGNRYFICGNRLHCFGGMKLHVHVQGDEATSPAAAPQAESGGTTSTSLPKPSSKSTIPITSASPAIFSHGEMDSVFLSFFGCVAVLSFVM